MRLPSYSCGKAIFKDCRDHDNFLERLGTILTKLSTAGYRISLDAEIKRDLIHK
jgi:hypothetical protein